MTPSVGPKTDKASSSKKSNNSHKIFYPSTSDTATIPPSSDRYHNIESAEHVRLPQNPSIKPLKRLQKLNVQTRLQVN